MSLSIPALKSLQILLSRYTYLQIHWLYFLLSMDHIFSSIWLIILDCIVDILIWKDSEFLFYPSE